MSEPMGHQQIYDSSVVLDLTFDLSGRGNTESNVKSTTPVSWRQECPAVSQKAGR
jgi:hypothetical protein